MTGEKDATAVMPGVEDDELLESCVAAYEAAWARLPGPDAHTVGLVRREAMREVLSLLRARNFAGLAIAAAIRAEGE